MSNSNNKEKELLNTLSDKITNPQMAYDMDEEEQINNCYSSKSEENIIENEDNNIITIKNNILKESLISPGALNKNIIEKLEKLFSIKSVKCKIHNKNYLKLDEDNFEVVCEKCIEEGKDSQLEIINDIESEGNIINCYMHTKSKGSFYCDECKEFICKMCFADEHRTHKCHLPEIIKREFVETLRESIAYSSELNPILNGSINDIKKIYDTIKKQKSDTIKIPENVLKIISNTNESQIDLLREKTKEKFIGIDNEVHDNYITHKLLKDKTKQYLENLKNICEQINNNENTKNNFELCEYHKEKTKYLIEILDHIKSSNNFINIRLHNTNNKYNENKEKIENSLNLMNKEITNYEKSCISSISTGRENRSIILRRYIHFSHNEIKYFKNCIIGFASNDDVFISGLTICGLYLKKKKQKINENPDNNENNNINIEEQNENNNDNENMKKKLSIQITISTMVNQAEGQKLYIQKCELTCVKGSEEPSVIINFEKGVKILKEKLYLIKVENLSEDNYIDIWTGSVGEANKKNMQIIRCHNSGIQFLFKKAEGIQTDFDEFEQGIIDGILYSTNK